jgi:N-methylhydantoinase A
MFRVGIDVGGTFTDFLVTDDSGESKIFKSPSTPQNPTEGVFSGLESAAASFGLNLKQFLSQIERIVHGTTITTNATLTGKGAKTGFITTSGFRDILNMRRGLRENQYQSKSSPPAPLVPRRLIGVIRERVDCTGAVITPLNQDDVVACARLFKVEDVEAVAISFLWSFVNPEHERRAAQIVREEMGDIYISISSDVLPQIRAYERHSTTVANLR